MPLGTNLPTRLIQSTGPIHYVDASIGSDSNTKNQAQSEATPWASVQKAMSTLVAGDRCYIKNGTYSPPGGFGGSTQYRHELALVGTALQPITFTNYPGHSPIIQSSSDSGAGNPTTALKILGAAKYIRIGNYNGFSLNGDRLIFQRQATNKGNSQVIDIAADAPATGASDIEIIGVELRNAYTASLCYAGDNCFRIHLYCIKCHSPAGFRDTETTLAAGIDNATTTVTVASGTGFANNDFVRIEAEGANTTEIIQISSGGGTGTWTVTRAQKGTVASAHAISAVVNKGAQHHALYQTGDNGVVANCFIHDMPQSFGIQIRTNQSNPGQSPSSTIVSNNTVVDCRQDYGSGPGGGTAYLMEGRAVNCVFANNIAKGCGNRGIDGGVPSGPSAQTTTAGADTLNNTTNPVTFTVASASGFPATNGYFILCQSEILLVTSGAGTTTWTASRGQLGSTNAAHSGTPTVTSHEAASNIGRKNISQGNTASQFSHSNANWRIINFDGSGGYTFGSGPGDNSVSDPKFTSYLPGINTNPDCSLDPSSPGRGYGIEEYCPTFDFYGRTRGGVDSGAFAANIVTSSPPPDPTVSPPSSSPKATGSGLIGMIGITPIDIRKVK